MGHAVNFEFATAGRIVFGSGTISMLPGLAAGFGTRALVLTGKNASRHARALDALSSAGIACTVTAVPGEPTVTMIDGILDGSRGAGIELVIGIGGGSVIDAAKAAAALLTNGTPLARHLEVIGEGKPLDRPALPCIAVATTAGTGSEVTRNAVIASPERGVKASLRHASMLPRVALVDPDLARSLPQDVTAHTGLDALTQLIEPFVCTRANPVTDSFCREGMALAARHLAAACADGTNAGAREGMALASLLGGMALANAGLGAVHGIAAVIGGRHPGAPHGGVCAALLPAVIEANAAAMGRSGRDGRRYGEAARIVTGRADAGPVELARWVRGLAASLSVPGLAAWGVRAEEAGDIARQALKSSSMKANPAPLSAGELEEIIGRSLDRPAALSQPS